MSETSKPQSLLLADDHPVFLLGLQTLIGNLEGYEVIEQVDNGQHAFEQITSKSPDIAILDIDMPYLSGIEVAARLREENTPTKIIILSYYWDENTLRIARDLKVEAVLLKQNALEEMAVCLEQIRAGLDYVGKNCYEMARNG